MKLLEELNRTMKLALDDGTAGSIEEAEALFRSFSIQIVVGDEVTTNRALQAALLTLLNAAPRTFSGGVTIGGNLIARLELGWHSGQSIRKAAESFGARCTPLNPDLLTVHIGRFPGFRARHPFQLYLACTARGFRLSPDDCDESYSGAMVEYGVAAAGAALCECFQYLYYRRMWAGQRSVTFDFPDVLKDYNSAARAIWVIGLGHVGQATLWAAGLAAYARGPRPRLRLQDDDRVTASSVSTGLLVRPNDIDRHKVTVVSTAMTELGFECEPIPSKVSLDEPLQSREERCVVAVDSFGMRRKLDNLRGTRIVEAGIGHDLGGFTKSQIHLLPGRRLAADIWCGEDPRATARTSISAPAYRKLLRDSGDECGTTQLAGRSIGTPFMGAFVGALICALTFRGDSEVGDSFAFDVSAL